VAYGYAQWFALAVSVPLLVAVFLMLPRLVVKRYLDDGRLRRRRIVRGQLQAWSPAFRLVLTQSDDYSVDHLEQLFRAALLGAEVPDSEPLPEATPLRQRLAAAYGRASLPTQLGVEAVLVFLLGSLAVAGTLYTPAVNLGSGTLPLSPVFGAIQSGAAAVIDAIPGFEPVATGLLTAGVLAATLIYQSWLFIAGFLALLAVAVSIAESSDTVRLSERHQRLLSRVGRGVFLAALPLIAVYAIAAIANGGLQQALDVATGSTVGLAAVVGVAGVVIGLLAYVLRDWMKRIGFRAAKGTGFWATLGLDTGRTALASAPYLLIMVVALVVGLIGGPSAALVASLAVWVGVKVARQVYERFMGRFTAYRQRSRRPAPYVTVRIGEPDDIEVSGAAIGIIEVSGTKLANDDPTLLARDAARTVAGLLSAGVSPPTESEYYYDDIYGGTVDRREVENELREFTRTHWRRVVTRHGDVDRAHDEMLRNFPPEYVAGVRQDLAEDRKLERVSNEYRWLGDV
jgi:hypothetical protein